MEFSKCTCPHHKIVPGLITLLGVVFLLQAIGIISSDVANMTWPTVIILIGLNKIFSGACKCCTRD